MAKATHPKPSMQIEWYCLAVHSNIHEHTLECVGVKKTNCWKSLIVSSFFLIQNSWLAYIF